MGPTGGVPWASGLGSGNSPASQGYGSGQGTNPFNLGGAMLGGGIGGMLSGLFGGQQSPASAASSYYNQIPGAVSQYMQPYEQAGQNALGALSGQYSNLLSNPGGVLNQIGSSYHQSPGFQFALHQALQGANQASAAGGMAGSPLGQQQNMGVATQLGNQDYYNYLNKAMGMYGQGLQGEQGLAGMGMQGGTNMSEIIANELSQQGQNAYQNQAAKNAAQGGMFGDIGAGIGALLPFASSFL